MFAKLLVRLKSLRRRLLPGSKRNKATKYVPGMTLSRFLLLNKRRYLDAIESGNGQRWTVVMGNEAGDLDSIACSIAYAWFASVTTGKPHVALIQTPHRDLKLRPENLHAFSLASLTPELDELLCINDIPKSSPFPSNKFVLVDHNRLLPQFSESNPNVTVVGVIDHHDDEGLYTTAKPRTIQVPTGSCTSLVALHMRKTRGENFEIPIEVATLLLTGVLIDTNALKHGGKAVKEDHEAAAFLIPRSTVASPVPNAAQLSLEDDSPVKKLSDELKEKKSATDSFTTNELLRRDYKQYEFRSSWTPDHKFVNLGLATVMVSLEYWIDRDKAEFWEQVDAFMDDQGIDVLGILTTFKEKERRGQTKEAKHMKKQLKGSNRRQALFVVRDFPDDGGIEERLWTGLEASTACGFILRSFEEFATADIPEGGVGERKARVYEQEHANQTRKTIAPLLRQVIEGTPEDED